MLVIILGYGIFQKRKLNYKKYLDTSLQLIEKMNSDHVLVSGGFTSQKYPQVSEAQSIKKYLIEQNPKLKKKIMLEEQSLTTLQNIAFCKNRIKQMKKKPEKIVIICDSIRVPKVFYLAMMHFNQILNVNSTEQETYNQLFQLQKEKIDITQNVTFSYKKLTLNGFPFKRKRKDIAKQILASITEIGEYHFPEIENENIKWRKKNSG